jgi:hypothetical protein
VVIYACRRGLSIARRGTLIACSGSGDCGGQVLGDRIRNPKKVQIMLTKSVGATGPSP